MGEFIFIVGGARSGKSRFAQGLAKKIGGKVAFIATCVPQDGEMKRRIALHKKKRPRSWVLIEEARDLKKAIRKAKNCDTVIIDCLGLLISNLMEAGWKDNRIEREIKSVVTALSGGRLTYIVVSNEVGAGIVPDNELSRRFRDVVGMANQAMSRRADKVYVMQAGIPIEIKNLK